VQFCRPGTPLGRLSSDREQRLTGLRAIEVDLEAGRGPLERAKGTRAIARA
jgi:hypothetical protein